MNDTIWLKAEGYQVAFEVRQTGPVEEDLDMRIVFILDPHLGNMRLEAEPIPVMVSDIPRLISYFEDHIAQLQKDPDSESFTFVLMDLQMQLQALSGEIRAADDGEFTMRFLVNVGKAEDGLRVYAGGESVIYLENVNAFLTAMRQLMSDLATSPPSPEGDREKE